MKNGEIILLDDEVNPAISAALNAGLEVTGLSATLLFEQPRLLTMNVSGEGTFQTLAGALKSTLNEAGRPRSGNRRTSTAGAQLPPVVNNIDPVPLNAVLSMRGVVTDGIYRAATGRVVLMKDDEGDADRPRDGDAHVDPRVWHQ